MFNQLPCLDIVKLEPVEIRLRLVWREELVEVGGVVRVEVIGHHPDIECIRVVVICKFDHSVNPLLGAPSVRDIDGYPPRQRFRGKVEFLFVVTFVVTVNTCDPLPAELGAGRAYSLGGFCLTRRNR